MDTWHFAHEYFGKLWKRMGFFMLIFSFVLTLVTYQISNGIQAMSSAVIVTLQTVLLIASIFPVEKALNKNFDKQGSRK
jgi:Flp pilus assembly pilin Flp